LAAVLRYTYSFVFVDCFYLLFLIVNWFGVLLLALFQVLWGQLDMTATIFLSSSPWSRRRCTDLLYI